MSAGAAETGATGDGPGRSPVPLRLVRWLLRTPAPWARAATLLWLAGIFALSEIPGRPGAGPEWLGFALNLGHGALYAGLATWVLLGFLPARDAASPSTGRAAAAPGPRGAVVVAGLCGLLDEFHQRFVPGRNFSLLDVATDLAGAAGAVCVLSYALRDDARTAGLWGRALVAILAAAGAAAAATYLPRILPHDWL